MQPGTYMGDLDASVVLGAAACAGSLAFGAPWEAGLATSLVLVAMALGARAQPVGRDRARARIVPFLAAAAFLASAARASAVVREFEHARAAVVAQTRGPTRCAITAVVRRSPVLVGDSFRTDVALTAASCLAGVDRVPVRATLHVPPSIAPSLARGDTIEAIGQLAPLHRFWNEELGDPRPLHARRGVHLSGGADDVLVTSEGRALASWIDRARARARWRIEQTFPPSTSPMARALVLGEDDLTTGDQRAFRRSGLAHLLAVSGMHLVLVVAGLVAALRAILVRITWIAVRVPPIRIASAIGIPCAWIYADLAGGSGSALRAAWMTSLALGAHVVARRPDAWRALGVSALGMIALDPLAPYDLSFGLSIAATTGILALGPPISRAALACTPALLAPLVRAIATSVAASIACAPLLASMTGDLPLAGILANVIAVPLGEAAALPLCLVHALLEPIPVAEHGCALAASGALALVRGIAHATSSLEWSTVHVPTPTAGQLAIVGGCAAMLSPGVLPARRKKAAVAVSLAALLALEWSARSRGMPRGVLRATILDVGQGDATILDLPDGRAMILDGGGLVGSPVDVGERVLAPVLRARRRKEIAAVVLSHPHPDHFGGLLSATRGVSVGALWDTGQGEREEMGGGYRALLAEMRARGVDVVRPPSLCGAHDLGAGAVLEVLAPCPEPASDRGPNDNSFVLRIRFGGRAFLFVGDAEREEEAELLARDRRAVRADLLKVGHHGSRTSSTRAFVDAVDPSVAVISCGVRNRFGHPAAATLETFATSRARLLRTDLDGAVVVTTDGASLEVRAAGD
ncbi:MAG: DNA internalization-related competence protein ComEC/Rec2 [Deltaproteobacteria bacterium]|nr:DNA internalization-related competence protein ComEC/Rec2 [Deltaproteobacteria bacterium]